MKYFADNLNKTDMTRKYGLDPMKMVQTVGQFVINNKYNAFAVDECFKPKLDRLPSKTAEDLMKIYWETDNLENCQMLRKTVVELYLRGEKDNVPGLSLKDFKGKKVQDVEPRHVDTIVRHYLTNFGKFHYERLFINKFLKHLTAVLVQKAWRK